MDHVVNASTTQRDHIVSGACQAITETQYRYEFKYTVNDTIDSLTFERLERLKFNVV